MIKYKQKKALMKRKRGVTYRNSRVKHKEKYKKALQILKTKGQYVKEHKLGPYGGEERGIKMGIIKGVSLKD